MKIIQGIYVVLMFGEVITLACLFGYIGCCVWHDWRERVEIRRQVIIIKALAKLNQ